MYNAEEDMCSRLLRIPLCPKLNSRKQIHPEASSPKHMTLTSLIISLLSVTTLVLTRLGSTPLANEPTCMMFSEINLRINC